MMQLPRSENRPMTFDEVSMERSKSFVKALQELKNLRPQLYTAAEYCESSYLHGEQKQMVLDNLKGYAVRALVNAVDHLGTVASKLTDLFEQQMFDVSVVETGISCLRQRSLTCQACVDKEGRSQHQMSFRTLRHHKHYTLPSLADKTAISNMQMPPKNDVKAKPSSETSGKASSKTLSWHLATSGGTSNASPCLGDPRTSKIKPELFHLLVPEEAAASLSSPSTNHLLAANGNATSDITSNKFGLSGGQSHRNSLVGSIHLVNHANPSQALKRRGRETCSCSSLAYLWLLDLRSGWFISLQGFKEASKPVQAIKSLHGHGALQIYRPRTRSRSMLSVFFSKPKTLTSRNISVS